MQIPFKATESLKNILSQHSVDLSEYRPAYGGESAGLDLYNTSTKNIIIPPVSKLTEEDQELFKISRLKKLNANIKSKTWLDLPKPLCKNTFKQLIPTGLHVAIPRNHVGLIRERGSITKTPLVLRAGVIDSGYTGEIFINAINTSPYPYVLKPGDKTPFQLIIIPCLVDYVPFSDKDFDQYVADAQRQQGKIGSSD